MLVDSGRFQLTKNISTTFLLVELMVIKHGYHVVTSSYLGTGNLKGDFFYSWCILIVCAKHLKLFKDSNINSVENLLISWLWLSPVSQHPW